MIEQMSDAVTVDLVDLSEEARGGVLGVAWCDELCARPMRWGFGELSRMVFLRTYSWDKGQLPHIYGEGAAGHEGWADCCVRVVEATARRYARHARRPMPRTFWRQMCEAMFEQRWSPPGRGLRYMGTRYIEERCGTPLYNCAFISTGGEGGIARAMRWAFMALALGTGVGYDTLATEAIVTPARSAVPHVVEDSREGWADALQMVYLAYTGRSLLHPLDTSRVRAEGAPVTGLGGKASGPAPLQLAYVRLCALCEAYVGRNTDSAFIVDLFDIQAVCILAGGTRRSAMIALGEPGDEVFASLKDSWDAPEAAWRWASNHSVRNPTAADHETIARHCAHNGEPAPIYIAAGAAQGRAGEAPHITPTYPEVGCNPCGEQLLASGEFCNLSEVVLSRAEDAPALLRAALYAYVYAKVVTTYEVFDAESAVIQAAHRRVGVGITGVAEAIDATGADVLGGWLDDAYELLRATDELHSDNLGIPRSVRLTTVKPSGTASLVLGCTPGVHYDHSPYYVRRMRLSRTSQWLPALIAAGYPVEDDAYAPQTMVVEFPVKSGAARGKADVSLREKVELVAWAQARWSDNMVSCTADFAGEEADQIAGLLDEFGGSRIKSISFLRREEHGYVQAPYEEITREEYEARVRALDAVHLAAAPIHEADDKYCDGASCEVSFG